MHSSFLSTASPGSGSKGTFLLFYNAQPGQPGYTEVPAPDPYRSSAAPLPLVAVLGPTGSGKSDLALDIAQQFDGEIVNCDSLQVFRHFDIGTAKMPEPERGGVPHHLIDIVNPDELFTAGEFARRARLTLADISRRGKLPILAGGTGFYVRALLDGLFPGPERDDLLRARLAPREQRRPGSLHRILLRLDPAAAGKIHPNDVPKVTRALEVCLLTRRKVTDLFAAGRDALLGYRVLKLGLNPDRDRLYERLDARCRAMFDAGLVDEVRRILSLGYPPACKPFESHGYRQAMQVIDGELNLREAVFYAQRNTRNYAKRQMTWFRRETNMVWLRGFGVDEAVRSAALARVAEFLAA
jgi:tRNA dimethylallyltransferase